MRRAFTYTTIAVLVSCLVVFAGHWTVAQNPEPEDDVVIQAEEHPAASNDVEEDDNEEASLDEGEHGEDGYDEQDYDDEWEREDDEWQDEDEHDFDEEFHEYEIHAAECELARRLADISSSHLETASWVIANIHEYLDDEEAANFLQQLLDEVEHPSIKRLVGLKLAELYSELDQTNQVKEQLRKLILRS